MQPAKLEALITTYCDAWNEADPQRRDAMLQQVWADDGSYCDPTVQISGRAALVAHIADVQARSPGSRILRTSRVDAHHGMLRFSFSRVDGHGELLRDGLDLGEVAGDGRLRRVTGFFGPLQPR
jgi:hypothetical protein